jgi:hypothetical protein
VARRTDTQREWSYPQCSGMNERGMEDPVSASTAFIVQGWEARGRFSLTRLPDEDDRDRGVAVASGDPPLEHLRGGGCAWSGKLHTLASRGSRGARPVGTGRP